VRQLSADQRQNWVDTMMPVWSKFSGDVGQDMIDAAQAINAGL
jgi:C4-dicarboxylate-binding protein DctP